MQKINVTPDVVRQDVEENKTEPSVATKVVTDILDPTIRDPPTRIEKNHPTENIIGELTDGI